MADEIDIAKFASPSEPLTIQYARRRVVVHSVTSEELDSISGIGSSVYLAFFGICLGALISFGIVLTTTTITSPYAFAAYVSLTAMSAVGAVLFGIRSYQEHKSCKSRLRQLKD